MVPQAKYANSIHIIKFLSTFDNLASNKIVHLVCSGGSIFDQKNLLRHWGSNLNDSDDICHEEAP